MKSIFGWVAGKNLFDCLFVHQHLLSGWLIYGCPFVWPWYELNWKLKETYTRKGASKRNASIAHIEEISDTLVNLTINYLSTCGFNLCRIPNRLFVSITDQHRFQWINLCLTTHRHNTGYLGSTECRIIKNWTRRNLPWSLSGCFRRM